MHDACNLPCIIVPNHSHTCKKFQARRVLYLLQSYPSVVQLQATCWNDLLKWADVLSTLWGGGQKTNEIKRYQRIGRICVEIYIIHLPPHEVTNQVPNIWHWNNRMQLSIGLWKLSISSLALVAVLYKKKFISSLVFPEEMTRLSYFFEWFYLCLSCFLHVYTYRYTIIVLNKLYFSIPAWHDSRMRLFRFRF